MSETAGPVLWTVYERPRDFPNSCVARKWIGENPTPQILIAPSVEALRVIFRGAGLACIPRQEGDEPHIVEIWL
jgi:hypothetical protein